MRSKMSSADLFAQAKLGIGATKCVGSDCYGYYVSFIDPTRKVIGLYEPRHWFKHDWTEGRMEHEPYKDGTAPEFYLQAFRGKWHWLDNLGKRGGVSRIHLGACSFYEDPSF